MTDRETLAALLFGEFGWPTRRGPGREDSDPGLVWGDLDNPAWRAVADRLIAAGVHLGDEGLRAAAVRALDAVLGMMDQADKGDTWPDMIDTAKSVIREEGLDVLEARVRAAAYLTEGDSR